MDIQLLTDNKTRYDATHHYGVQHVHSKKEFLEVAGKLFDAVKENHNLIIELKLTNMENC